MNQKLDELLKRREQLNAQIQKIRTKEANQKRKEDTRRKVLLGALMMEMMEKGEIDSQKIRKKLSSFITKDIDRKLFDLPNLPQKK